MAATSKLLEKHFSSTLTNFILLTVTWSSQIHRELTVDFSLQQLLRKNTTILSYKHITDFVHPVFFLQVLYMTYYWSDLNKELSIFSSSHKTAKFVIMQNHYITQFFVTSRKIAVIIRNDCFIKNPEEKICILKRLSRSGRTEMHIKKVQN